MSTTTIRLKLSTKKKADQLRKGLSYDKYVSRLNDYVEKTNFDIERSPEDIPKLIKERTTAIIKIIRAFEKQYLGPTKHFTELILENNYDQTQKKEEQNTVSSDQIKDNVSDEKVLKLEKKIRFLEEELKKKSTSNIAQNVREDIIDIIDDIKNKSEDGTGQNNGKLLFSQFFFNQKIDLVRRKINRL